MTAPIIVTGAPGNVGTPLVLELLHLGAPVRVAARDVAAARAVFGDAVDVVPFDFERPGTFGAFAGAERMFLLRPPHIADVDGLIVPTLRAAAAAGVRHVVFLSIQGAERNRIVPHHKIEDRLRASGMAWTFVRAAYFMQNLSTTHAPEIRELDEIWVPAGRSSRTAHVDARDVAAIAARALVEDGHEGMAYTPTGPAALTYDEIAGMLARELGRPIRYADPGLLAFWHRLRRRGMPRGMVGVMLGIYTAARLGLAAGLSDDVARLTGRQPIPMEQFVHDARDAWLRPSDRSAPHPSADAAPSGPGAG